MSKMIAWDLVGFDGQLPYDDQYDALGMEPGTVGQVRIVGGRTLYEYVANNGGERVKLGRLAEDGTLRAIYRYVDADTPMEFIPDKEGPA